MWATLHFDVGVTGEFEFPGDDEPVTIADGNVSFLVNAGEAGEATTMADTGDRPHLLPKRRPLCPPPTATPLLRIMGAPDMLPTTGGSLAGESNALLPWMIVGVAYLARHQVWILFR